MSDEGDAAEVEVYQSPPRVDRSKMEVWADDLRAAYIIAERLVTTSFAPAAYRDKPQEAAAAIMAGQEIGLSPLASLRSIDIIEGTPGMRAITLRALVQAHGHDIWIEESNQSRAIVKGRRKGSARVETSVWDTARADKMQLMSKSNYRKQPGAMFIARGTSEIARLIDADGILGLAYSTEELMDMDESLQLEQVEPVKPARRAMKRKVLPEPGEVVDPPLPVDEEAVFAEEFPALQPAAPTPEDIAAVMDVPVEVLGERKPVVEWEVAPIPGADREFTGEIVEPTIDWKNDSGESV